MTGNCDEYGYHYSVQDLLDLTQGLSEECLNCKNADELDVVDQESDRPRHLEFEDKENTEEFMQLEDSLRYFSYSDSLL